MAKKKSKPLTPKEKALLKEAGFNPDAKPESFWAKHLREKGIIKPGKPKPHKHGKLERYGSFTELGYDVTAYICDADYPHFLIEFAKDGKVVHREELPPLMYGAKFGVDIDDKALLEEETDKTLKKLAGRK